MSTCSTRRRLPDHTPHGPEDLFSGSDVDWLVEALKASPRDSRASPGRGLTGAKTAAKHIGLTAANLDCASR